MSERILVFRQFNTVLGDTVLLDRHTLQEIQAAHIFAPNVVNLLFIRAMTTLGTTLAVSGLLLRPYRAKNRQVLNVATFLVVFYQFLRGEILIVVNILSLIHRHQTEALGCSGQLCTLILVLNPEGHQIWRVVIVDVAADHV